MEPDVDLPAIDIEEGEAAAEDLNIVVGTARAGLSNLLVGTYGNEVLTVIANAPDNFIGYLQAARP